MKKAVLILTSMLMLLMLSSCELATGIFKAGMGFGIFVVVLIIGLVAFLIFKARKK